MRKLFGWPKLLDHYVTRICLGSFVVCFCFVIGLMVVFELFANLDDYIANIDKLPDQYKRYGFFLVVAYYLTNLPFLYLVVAPFVTVTAGMFAVSRLMGSNEVVPMIFTGRRLHRVLLPVFLLGLGNTVAMAAIRQFALPRLVTAKDNLSQMINEGLTERAIDNCQVKLPEGNLLYARRLWLETAVLEGMNLRLDRADGRGDDAVDAKRADFVEDGPRGPGWRLEQGTRREFGAVEGRQIDFLPVAQVPGFTPVLLRNRMKQSAELIDLSYSALLGLVREQPTVYDYTVAFHHHVTFPLANLLLLLLALPFALRFERGSKTERVFFALVVCGAYLVIDLIFQSLGKQGVLQPVVAAWLPTVIFGSLGIVMFDTVRT